ncbi:MAG TPA: immunoglobulin domain-containing protein, partial [Pyrinomonadaceae bacterium]|nr:immunoglobulin domain-containing protein [Pyrinomonadaceae bacterium]
MFDSQTRRANSRTARQSYRVLSILALFAVSAATLFVVSVSSHSGGPNRLGESALRTKHRISMRPASGSLRTTPLLAAPLLVTITVDRTDDAPSASACTALPNDCSLRGAVDFANLAPATTINVPAGTYQLTIDGSSEGFAGDNSIGDLDITATNTAIVGAGAGTTIIQQTQLNDRVIEVNPFLDAGFVSSISGVTVTGGKETTAACGGGIVAGSIGNALTVSNSVISGNSATGAGTFGGGGICFTGGSLTLSGTTVSGNSTSGSGGGIVYSAGDLLGRTPSPGVLSVTNSTFSSNSAAGGGGGALDLFDFNLGTGTYNITGSSFNNNTATTGNGGAILVESGGPLTVSTSSFATNSAGTSGGAIFSNAGVSTIRYSRFVGNTVPVPTNGLTIFKGPGLLTADDNWWGINTGPTANDIRSASGSIFPTTYLQLQASANPNTICVGGTSTINADIKKRNAGPDLTVELNGLPPFPATFINTTPAVGTLSGVSANFVDGAASATFTGTATGTANIDVIADNQTVTATVTVGSNATTDPADQMVCEGATANFTTNSSGPGPFTYVWKKGATVLNNGDLGGRVTITSGSNTSTLSISNVQASDADTYTVEATGACSTATQTATLSINPPTTTTDPADATVCQGATANFSTTAGGTGPFSYAWTLDGSPFNGNSPSINVPTGSLSVGNHTVAVTTTGACGSASQSATLTVQEGTSTTDPADATVCQGATASFSTTASGTGPFSYAWTLDGSPFNGNSPSINVPTGSLSVGNHTVAVTTTGGCGSASQSATLTVQPTTTTSDPADVAVCQGATANFSTTAGGTGPFSYAWTLDGSPFNGNSPSINVPTGSLSVGNHTVAVTTTGACGSASQSATLTVQAPTATTDPMDQTVCKGATANFSTTASGTGPFHYAWTLDGVPFNGDSASISVPTGSLSSGPHTVAVTTSGTCGSASQSATLTVGSPPVITLTTSNINMWPPNHAYHTFTAADFGASASGCDGDLTSSIVIASISSDEPEDNPLGADGSTLNDIVIAANCKS